MVGNPAQHICVSTLFPIVMVSLLVASFVRLVLVGTGIVGGQDLAKLKELRASLDKVSHKSK